MKETYGLFIIERGQKMENRDYTIVETDESILFRFNSIFIDLLENINKENFHKSQENYNHLIKLYAIFSDNFSKKQNLGILLNELKRKMDYNILKNSIDKKIIKHKLVPLKEQKIEFKEIEFNELPTKRILNKEERKLDVLSKFIKNLKLKEYKIEKGDDELKPKIPEIKFNKIKKKISDKEKKLSEVRKLIIQKKYLEARKLLKQDL